MSSHPGLLPYFASTLLSATQCTCGMNIIVPSNNCLILLIRRKLYLILKYKGTTRPSFQSLWPIPTAFEIWHNGSSWYVIFYFCAKFQLSTLIRSVSSQELPVVKVHTWRMLMVPDWIFGGWGHPWHHGLSRCVIFDLFAKFQLSSMIRSVSRTLQPWSHTRRMLMVPDWILEGWGHSYHQGLS